MTLGQHVVHQELENNGCLKGHVTEVGSGCLICPPPVVSFTRQKDISLYPGMVPLIIPLFLAIPTKGWFGRVLRKW